MSQSKQPLDLRRSFADRPHQGAEEYLGCTVERSGRTAGSPVSVGQEVDDPSRPAPGLPAGGLSLTLGRRRALRAGFCIAASHGIAPSLRGRHWIGQAVNRPPISPSLTDICVEANREASTFWARSGTAGFRKGIKHLGIEELVIA